MLMCSADQNGDLGMIIIFGNAGNAYTLDDPSFEGIILTSIEDYFDNENSAGPKVVVSDYNNDGMDDIVYTLGKGKVQ